MECISRCSVDWGSIHRVATERYAMALRKLAKIRSFVSKFLIRNLIIVFFAGIASPAMAEFNFIKRSVASGNEVEVILKPFTWRSTEDGFVACEGEYQDEKRWEPRCRIRASGIMKYLTAELFGRQLPVAVALERELGLGVKINEIMESPGGWLSIKYIHASTPPINYLGEGLTSKERTVNFRNRLLGYLNLAVAIVAAVFLIYAIGYFADSIDARNNSAAGTVDSPQEAIRQEPSSVVGNDIRGRKKGRRKVVIDRDLSAGKNRDE